jgi:hypothetical protein
VPAPIDIVYTTIGGVIGAALTQYVTHLRDRRAARALIIEKVAAAEAEYVLFADEVNESSTDQKNADRSKLNAAPASVEAACLIAGVPRANVMAYIVSRQLGAQVRLTVRFTAWFTGKVDRLRQIAALDEHKAQLSEVSSRLEQHQTANSELDACSAQLDVAALDELRRSVWHPFMVQLRKRKLYKLQQMLKETEARVCRMEQLVRRAQAAQIGAESLRRI